MGLRALWVAAAVSLLPLFILFSPLCIVTLPLWFVFGLAIGPLQELANARLRCAVCRHELHEPTDDRQSAPDKARVDSNEPNQTAAETRVVALNGGWRKRRSR